MDATRFEGDCVRVCPTELVVEDGLVEQVVTVTAELVRAWKLEDDVRLGVGI